MKRWWVIDEDQFRDALERARAGEHVPSILMSLRATAVVEDHTGRER